MDNHDLKRVVKETLFRNLVELLKEWTDPEVSASKATDVAKNVKLFQVTPKPETRLLLDVLKMKAKTVFYLELMLSSV